MDEKILKLATNISREKLVSWNKTHKIQLHITILDYLVPYAKYKVWIKPGAEQSFLYGKNVLKSRPGWITENNFQYQGEVVYSMTDIPLNFGVAAKSAQDWRKVDSMVILVFHHRHWGICVAWRDTDLRQNHCKDLCYVERRCFVSCICVCSSIMLNSVNNVNSSRTS